MFARFDENPAMTLRVIKETKRYGRTDARTDGQRENSIPPTNKVCGGYKMEAKLLTQFTSGYYMGLETKKRVFGGLRTTQAQTSLCIRAV